MADLGTNVRYIKGIGEVRANALEKLGIVNAAVAEKALPKCNLVCITGAEMKTAVSGYLQTLYDLKPEAVGGAMPDDGFYRLGT